MFFKFFPLGHKTTPHENARHAVVINKLDNHEKIMEKQTEILEKLCGVSDKIWEEILRGNRILTHV